MKKAQKKYVANNREEDKCYTGAYYHRPKDDPEYKERKKVHNQRYRQRQHLRKIAHEENIEPIYMKA